MYTTYVLVLDKISVSDVAFGKRLFFMARGLYMYVGSAKRGLDHRLARHLRKVKPLRWHVDYLTTRDDITVRAVFLSPLGECETFRRVAALGAPFGQRLGSSDCRCPSHFVALSARSMRAVEHRLSEFGFLRYLPAAAQQRS
jgi:Uri superfamily endonuclease